MFYSYLKAADEAKSNGWAKLTVGATKSCIVQE